MRHWLRRAAQAADEPEPEVKSSSEVQLDEIRHNTHILHEWLTDLDQNMQQHLSLLKTLAECVKRQQALARTMAVSETGQEADEGHIGSKTDSDLEEDVWLQSSVPLSDEEDTV
jgi:hypothetical protein